MSSGGGLHSSYIMFHRAQRDHERLQQSYKQWLAKRDKIKQDLVKQIATINDSGPSAKKVTNKLSKLNAQLSAFEEEEAEEADPELLESSPHARPCHRPAYRKLAFENAIKQSEERKSLAEEVYNAALAANPSLARAKPARSEPVSEAQDAPPPSPPLTPEASSGFKPMMSKLKKIDAFLSKLESGRGMTKTFTPDRQSPSYSRWSPRAGTFEPGRPKPPPS